MIEDLMGTIDHGTNGEGSTLSVRQGGQQIETAMSEPCILATKLMEQICVRANLNRAYKRVRANKGSAGIDGMTVEELLPYLRAHKEQWVASLLDGSYQPEPVRQVAIPKAGGGKRQLGIPTVCDRLVQQAILQVLTPLLDPDFSESSYGYRPGRSAHAAVKQASAYVRGGRRWVVDIDLESFFDRVNHDILMSRLARKIGDKRLLKLIRRFLTAGLMQNGVVVRGQIGTPQGGPLSPLLSNVLLDELDKELGSRGHKFCRYADDHNIYVRSKRAGERVYASVKRFLETKLKLKVNDKKSAVAIVSDRKFLGYRIRRDGALLVSPSSVKRAKDKIRELTRRNAGKSFASVLKTLNAYLRGWLHYYQLAEIRSLWRRLDSWIRRKLRCYRLKQQRKYTTVVKFLTNLGVSRIEAMRIGSSGKGHWRLSRTQAVHQALSKAWFHSQGLLNLEERWEEVVKI